MPARLIAVCVFVALPTTAAADGPVVTTARATPLCSQAQLAHALRTRQAAFHVAAPKVRVHFVDDHAAILYVGTRQRRITLSGLRGTAAARELAIAAFDLALVAPTLAPFDPPKRKQVTDTTPTPQSAKPTRAPRHQVITQTATATSAATQPRLAARMGIGMILGQGLESTTKRAAGMALQLGVARHRWHGWAQLEWNRVGVTGQGTTVAAGIDTYRARTGVSAQVDRTAVGVNVLAAQARMRGATHGRHLLWGAGITAEHRVSTTQNTALALTIGADGYTTQVQQANPMTGDIVIATPRVRLWAGVALQWGHH